LTITGGKLQTILATERFVECSEVKRANTRANTKEESRIHKIGARVTTDEAPINFLDHHGAVISYILKSAISVHFLSVISP
jgi:hypothetical protein